MRSNNGIRSLIAATAAIAVVTAPLLAVAQTTGTQLTPVPVMAAPRPAVQAQPQANTNHAPVPGGQSAFPAPVADPAYRTSASAMPAVPLPTRARIYAGQAAVYTLPSGLKRVAVGSGEMLEVTNVGPRDLIMMGMKAGSTTVHLWLQNGKQLQVQVDISENDAVSLAETIRTLLADVEKINVHAVADRVVITGQDINPGIGSRIDAIQKIYPTVLNFTTADPVGMRPMVQMDVKIMEFDTNALEELGIQWDNVIRGPVAGIVKDFTNNNYYRINPEQSPANGVLLPNKLQGTQAFFGIATQIGSAINLMMNKGKAFLLASPQLSARSGGQAKFLAGGEVPIPVPQGFGQVTVDYKEYGIKLDIEPLVNFNEDISTRILAEVSRVDPTVTVQGVPGFTTRRTESEINVHAGETIVISGLIDSSAQQDAKRLPLLGDIPILGKLFRSDGFRGNRTELVMFVTPRVVTPGSQENLDGLERARQIQERGQQAMPRRNKDFVQ
ncbi:type II and III secretion system protein [Stenotrophomonas maltophilia]|uniref:type II and III secretion system protein family protein n=1 Tax=Stenotrophomonas maltophilia TaxID=40324 RepID=UPI0010943B32|nr:pilus assembly protein N-terminal domain-containing protein [Stenotrophomonas maltophilia]TGW22428.1 type II and III secretion system protein [Stenotrophomonas maltophilia]